MPQATTCEAAAPEPGSIAYRQRQILYQAAVLAAALALLLAAVSLRLADSQGVVAPLWGELPGVCVWRRLCGIDCPGCGLTRAFVAVAHGQWGTAWRLNPAGPLIFAAVLYQVPFRFAQLRRLLSGREAMTHPALLVVITAWLLVMVLVGQWIWRIQ